ncbi:MAG TPA: class I SAM-dependent methyltransferase [Polyangiaceae bacterium]|nr:class I SAM-dependent methyltransferase [Polyangiaceae bacterium]
MIELTPELIGGLPKNGATDPIEFYRRPLVGRLFRERINMGLRLLPARRFQRALEIGYGAGAVLLTLAPSVEELHGLDLDADPEPVKSLLASRGHTATPVRGSVYTLPYASDYFDLVVSFSVFEHLHEYKKALAEVRRALAPGGLFLLGMPAVNRAMEVGFRAIGFKGIEDHHVTRPADVAQEFQSVGFKVIGSRQLQPRPLPFALYYTWLLEREAGPA